MADVPAQAVLNEAALKRFDPYVKQILGTAKYVALYQFDPKENQWKKTDVEGSLFVYSRTGQPFHNILVLNRLSKNNLVEPITKGLDLQLQEPFLLYRNSKFAIFGIWFYAKEECTKLAKLIEDLMKHSEGNSSAKSVKLNGSTNIDIYSMLSKAQEAYKTGLGGPEELATKLSPQESEKTPKSVMEFFAKASDKGKRIAIGAPPIVEPREKLDPIIHRLMSNPVHTVEHIEKQQRSVTPQSNDNNSVALFFRPMSSENVKMNESVVENGTKGNFVRIFSPSSHTAEQNTDIRPLSAPHAAIETPQKPALMPPAMFTPSASKKEENNEVRPEPLTKNQLLQAITYLLKHDPEFMNKIHEAYVKSLMDMVL